MSVEERLSFLLCLLKQLLFGGEDSSQFLNDICLHAVLFSESLDIEGCGKEDAHIFIDSTKI